MARLCLYYFSPIAIALALGIVGVIIPDWLIAKHGGDVGVISGETSFDTARWGLWRRCYTFDVEDSSDVVTDTFEKCTTSFDDLPTGYRSGLHAVQALTLVAISLTALAGALGAALGFTKQKFPAMPWKIGYGIFILACLLYMIAAFVYLGTSRKTYLTDTDTFRAQCDDACDFATGWWMVLTAGLMPLFYLLLVLCNNALHPVAPHEKEVPPMPDVSFPSTSGIVIDPMTAPFNPHMAAYGAQFPNTHIPAHLGTANAFPRGPVPSPVTYMESHAGLPIPQPSPFDFHPSPHIAGDYQLAYGNSFVSQQSHSSTGSAFPNATSNVKTLDDHVAGLSGHSFNADMTPVVPAIPEPPIIVPPHWSH